MRPSTSAKQSRLRSSAWNGAVIGCSLLLAVMFAESPAAGQPVPKEYQLRAVMLWRFAQFTDWPVSAFESTNSPLVIGVLGENPFGEALRLAVKDETAHGRAIEVKYFRRGQNAAASCHVLYISQSEAGHLKEIVTSLNQKPVLTVSEIEGFAREQGGMIRFVTEQSRVGIRVNIEAVKAAHLVVDSRLLRLAEIARNP